MNNMFMTSRKNEPAVVFVGGSFTSLALAYYTKIRYPKIKVLIVEKEKEVGGLKRSVQYENGLCFDKGCHMFVETGIHHIDEFFMQIFDSQDDWSIFSGSKRDLSGTYFNGQLQLSSPAPDLRSFSQEKKKKYYSEIMQSIADTKQLNQEPTNLFDKFNKLLGPSLTNDIIRPAYEKIFKDKLENLGLIPYSILQLGLVSLFDNDVMVDLMHSRLIASRLSFPDVLSLNDQFFPKSNYLYPKKMGVSSVTNALVKKILSLGVEILTNSSVSKVNYSLDPVTGLKQISSVEINTNEGDYIQDTIQLYWASGLPLLARYLGLDIGSFEVEKIKSAYVNLTLKNKPNCGEVYYFTCLDPSMKTFRVTNYYGFCKDSHSKEYGYPLTVNMVLDESDERPEDIAIEELRRMGVIDSDNEVTFIDVIKESGIHKPTCEYEAKMNEIRIKIEKEKIANLIPTGMLSKPHIFYMFQDLINAFYTAYPRDFEKQLLKV